MPPEIHFQSPKFIGQDYTTIQSHGFGVNACLKGGILTTTSLYENPLYASGDRFLEYQTLDYPQVVETAGETGTFSTALEEQLGQKYLGICRVTESKVWPKWLWFLPALVFGWLWWQSMSKSVRRKFPDDLSDDADRNR